MPDGVMWSPATAIPTTPRRMTHLILLRFIPLSMLLLTDSAAGEYASSFLLARFFRFCQYCSISTVGVFFFFFVVVVFNFNFCFLSGLFVWFYFGSVCFLFPALLQVNLGFEVLCVQQSKIVLPSYLIRSCFRIISMENCAYLSF